MYNSVVYDYEETIIDYMSGTLETSKSNISYNLFVHLHENLRWHFESLT